MDERKDFMFSRKDLQRLIIPLIVEQFLSITIGMADTVMVSVCGEAAVSGPGHRRRNRLLPVYRTGRSRQSL